MLELPWPTRDDVISMKAISASERYNDAKKQQDVMDIMKNLEMYPGPMRFSGSAKATHDMALMKCLVSVLANNSTWSEDEWVTRLGV